MLHQCHTTCRSAGPKNLALMTENIIPHTIEHTVCPFQCHQWFYFWLHLKASHTFFPRVFWCIFRWLVAMEICTCESILTSIGVIPWFHAVLSEVSSWRKGTGIFSVNPRFLLTPAEICTLWSWSILHTTHQFAVGFRMSYLWDQLLSQAGIKHVDHACNMGWNQTSECRLYFHKVGRKITALHYCSCIAIQALPH